jgi:hypothetical protein
VFVGFSVVFQVEGLSGVGGDIIAAAVNGRGGGCFS